MDYWIRLIYAAAHVIALICFVRARLWRRFPVLFAYACVSGSLAFGYHPESKDWITNVYMRLEPVALALRFLCAAEVCWYVVRSTRERVLLIVGLSLIGFAFSASIWRLWPGSEVYTFVQFRRFFQISTAAFLLTGTGVFFITGLWKWNYVGYYTVVLLVLLVKQAFYSVLSMKQFWAHQSWHAADWHGLAVTSLCFLAWSALATWPPPAQSDEADRQIDLTDPRYQQ